MLSDGQVYFKLLREGDVDPPDVVDLGYSNMPSVLDLMLSPPTDPTADNNDLNTGNVTADAGFPKGHPGYEEGFGQDMTGWEEKYAHLGPQGYGKNPKWMAPYSHLGTGRIKKFVGGSAVKLSYFLNEFSKEMNGHYVPLKVRGFMIRRYLGNAAYEDIIKPLDRIGLGNEY